MMNTTRLVFIFIGLATAGLALSYGLVGWWPATIAWLACGGLWALGQWRKWDGSATFGLVFFSLGAAAGLLYKQSPLLMLVVLVAALSSWDLDYFSRRLSSAGRVDQAAVMEQEHLRRLLVVDGAALLLTGGVLMVRARFGFAIIFWLGLVAFLGISQVLGFLHSESES